ncbi:MAG: lactate dehydrogenase [Clostridiales bacterium]|jgi:LDH2 family malate/lactate/ureidoglycolate dehydrogenase|nr:lactate dehydrogenase [Clostridiales bacterium]
MSNTVTYIPAQPLADYCSALFQSLGMSKEDALINTDNIIEANLTGVDTHGVTRMAIYLERIRKGIVEANTNVKIISESPSTAVLDAGNGMGAVASKKAMELAIAKARDIGTAFVTVRNSNHYGTAAYFTKMAIKEGMIGFSATNGAARMAPWGSKDTYLGTNPFSLAVPAGEELPIIADMATSLVARGKIILAAKNGQSIPLGWAIDKDGADTTDAQKALEGNVLPFAGPKGSAIAILIEVMAGIMSGALYGPNVRDMYEDFTNPTGVGHVFGAIDISRFMPMDQYCKLVDQMIREIKNTTPAQGVTEIFMPGEIELRKRQERLAKGIPVSPAILKELAEEGKKCGVLFPWTEEVTV